MRLLIATSTRPKAQENFDEICMLLRAGAEQNGMNIPEGIIWTQGPGCYNLAFDLNGGDEKLQERFANDITMQLMPAKWSTTSDNLPETDTLETE